ncbi:hypothetical protein [Streptomyces sp. NPDC029004]|uniref:hypothetical protein n=1 Tax=Streptomyces sp. NPDC029004 TaxID=3154490 RepID=UPI00340CA66F
MNIRNRAVLAAAVGAALLPTGCSQWPGGEDTKPLSVAGVKKQAAEAGAGADTCPVPYDIVAAARAAGLTGRAGVPGNGPHAWGERADSPDSVLGKADGAVLDCAYRINSEDLHVFTSGVAKGVAVSVMAPRIQRDAGMGVSALSAFVEKADKAAEGEPVVTPGGNVATVRLPVAGGGDIALIVSFGEGTNGFGADRAGEIAKALAGQAHS